MKKLLLLFLLFTGFCKAQIINIPNPDFKDMLVNAGPNDWIAFTSLAEDAPAVVIDTNQDGQIQTTEAALIVKLNLENHNLQGGIVGITSFVNLVDLNMDFCNLVSADVSNMPNLKFLRVRENDDLANLNVTGNAQLQEIDCTYAFELTALDLTGLTNLKKLTANRCNLTSLNLSPVPNLEMLGVHTNQLGALDVSVTPNLKSLSCSNNHLTTLNVSSLTQLESLDCSTNNLTTLNLGTISNLTILGCSSNQLTSLNLSSLDNLTRLGCAENPLGSINLTPLVHLTDLDCSGNQLTTLDLSSQTQLEMLICSSNQLTTLNTAPLINMGHLNISSNLFSAIDLSPMPALGHFNCGYNQFMAYTFPADNVIQEFYCTGNPGAILDLAGLSDLEDLRCGGAQLTSIISTQPNPVYMMRVEDSPLLTTFDSSNLVDLHEVNFGVNALQALDISQNPGIMINSSDPFNDLTYINAKNGHDDSFGWGLLGAPNLEYICADEFEMTELALDFPGVSVNSYCSFVPGGLNNSISGNIIFDGNNNGCGSGDAPLLFTRFNVTHNSESGSAFSNTTGNYAIFTQDGSYTLTPIVENGSFFTFSPPSATITFAAVNGQTFMQSFCVTPNGIHADAEIMIVPLGAARPGFDAHYKLIYKNKGNQVLNGNIVLTFDDTRTDFVSATPAINSQSVNTLSWGYSNLAPFEVRSIDFTINLNGPMETPPLNDADILDFNADMVFVIPDNAPFVTSAQLHQIIVNSLDPNDKTCLEGNTISPDMIGDYVHYNINFENIGTAPAQNVVVKDAIDTSKFEIETLQVTYASHPVETRVNGNIVEFMFENINLPGTSGQNKGNVVFKIKTKPTLVLGNSISNKAEIFFDYNFPIETNAATSTFSLLKNDEFKTDATIGIAPNPAKNKVNVKADSNIKSIQLFDGQGRILQTSTQNNREVSFDISGKSNGVYFLKITTEKGTKTEKLIKN
ncbi:T9SS type A sorting domain-containing protein [Flavobacterium sp.]|uniref:DUF7619 domain-containing protein n=1 Tax=Flavobacterium sp. TaxID=239 RepID=UPI0039E3F1BB